MRWLVAAALAGCLPQKAATEVVVTVDTTFGVPCTIDALRFEITGPGGTVTQDVALTGTELPGSITLVADSPDRDTVTVSGLRQGEVFAQAQSEVTFQDRDSVELRFVLDRDCLAAPCPAVGIGAYSELPAPLPKRGCGATAYAWQPSVFEMRDACEMAAADAPTTILRDIDEREDPSPYPAMPFAFDFYGEPVTKIWVGTNGYLGFGDTQPNALQANVNSARPLGDPDGFPTRGALPFWNNLRTGPDGVCFATTGAFPDRVLWITWQKACFASSTVTMCGALADGVLTFGVALEETSDRIYFGYPQMTGAGSTTDAAQGVDATIGITSNAPKACPATECGTDGRCASGEPCGYTQISAQTALDLTRTFELDPE